MTYYTTNTMVCPYFLLKDIIYAVRSCICLVSRNKLKLLHNLAIYKYAIFLIYNNGIVRYNSQASWAIDSAVLMYLVVVPPGGILSRASPASTVAIYQLYHSNIVPNAQSTKRRGY